MTVPPSYSYRLATGTITVAQNRVLAFTVPAGQRVVIRTISVQAAGASGVALLLYVGAGGPFLTRVDVPAGSAGVRVDSRIILHEGEGCYVRALVASHDYSLHGYLFSGSGAPGLPSSLPAP